jgi:MFS family permease
MARTLANTYLLSRVITAVHTALQDFVASASLLYTKQLQSTTLPLQMVWFSLSFGSYGLLTWINTLFVEIHLENVYFNALLFAISNLPGNILSALLLDQIGRTKLLTGSILAASLSLLPFAFVAENVKNSGSHRTLTIVVSACLFQCFTCAAWNTIDVLTSELFPTSVRSTGMGVCAATGRIGAMVAQFVNGFLVARPFRLLVVSAITLLLGSMTPYFLHVSDPTGQPVRDFANTTQREEVDDESIVMLSSEQWDRQNKDGETYHRFSSAHGQTS